MPTFFSKVFSRGKDKEKGKDGGREPASPTIKQGKRASIHSLLEGKFEAVSPAISPSASKSGEIDTQKDAEKIKDKEKSGLFRPLSRTKANNASAQKAENAPHLTLNLNLPSLKDESKQTGNLDVVYESVVVLSDAELGERRLSVSEALKLMRACSNVISSRGLETLGIMHPHWYSSSPAVQRKIISLYLGSLISPEGRDSAIKSNSVSTAFEYELEYARDPHDVAAVFRWALRHLKLDGKFFGKDDETLLGWYNAFSSEEKRKKYPPKAYTDVLIPLIKPTHVELLNAILSLFSSLASHSEANGASGSRLSMSLGHYLLTGNIVDGKEDWPAFYASWERSGRALEHIFLASLRDEDTKTKVPRRLAELIAKYPYSKRAIDERFPRPAAFATRAYDALYVQITSELPEGTKPSSELRLPLRTVENALKSTHGEKSEDADVSALWEQLKKTSTAATESSSSIDQSETLAMLSRILSDDTISMLSLKSDRTDRASPTITAFTVSSALPQSAKPSVQTNGKSKPSNGSVSVSRNASEATTDHQSPIASDWTFFSSAGFGESSTGQSLAATLMDSDVEKTQPPVVARRRSQKKRGRSPNSKPAKIETSAPSTPATEVKEFKSTIVSIVQVDESFVDFWNDALIDPISDSWPSFVVCQLKPTISLTTGDKKITHLVIEQKFVPPPPPPVEEPPSPVRRASSPKPSIRSESDGRPSMAGRVSSTFSATRRRFNFFGGGSSGDKIATVTSADNKEAKKPAKSVKIGEMGEIIPEETSPKQATDKEEPGVKEESMKENSGNDAAAVVAGIAVAGAGAAIVAATEKALDAGADAEKPAEPIEQKQETVEVPAVTQEIATRANIPEAKETAAEVTEVEKEGPVPAVSPAVASVPQVDSSEEPTKPAVHTTETEPLAVPAGTPEDVTVAATEEEKQLEPLVAAILDPEVAENVKEVKESEPVDVPEPAAAVEVKEETSAPSIPNNTDVTPAPTVQPEVPNVAAVEHEETSISIPTEAKEEPQAEQTTSVPVTEEAPSTDKPEVGVPKVPTSTEEHHTVPTEVEPAPAAEGVSPKEEESAEPELVSVQEEHAVLSEENSAPPEATADELKATEEVEVEHVSEIVKEDIEATPEDVREASEVVKDESPIVEDVQEAAQPSLEPEGVVATETLSSEAAKEVEVPGSAPSISELVEESNIDESTKERDETASHRGADGSRFVEHLHTPPEPKPTEPEPAIADQAAALPTSQEQVSAPVDVVSVVPEEDTCVSEPDEVQTNPSTEPTRTDTTEEPAGPIQADTTDEPEVIKADINQESVTSEPEVPSPPTPAAVVIPVEELAETSEMSVEPVAGQVAPLPDNAQEEQALPVQEPEVSQQVQEPPSAPVNEETPAVSRPSEETTPQPKPLEDEAVAPSDGEVQAEVSEDTPESS